MTRQKQPWADPDPAGDYTLLDAGRELPTVRQVVKRAVWTGIAVVALVQLAAAASAWITSDTTWWPLSVLASVLLALLLLMVVRVPRPRVRGAFSREPWAPVVRDAVAGGRLPDGEQRQKAAGGSACQEIEVLVLVISAILGVGVAMIWWPEARTLWPMTLAVGVIIGLTSAPRAVRGRKYLDLYHRES